MKKKNLILSLYRFLDAAFRDLGRKKNRYEPNIKCQDNICLLLDKGMGDFILFVHYLKGFIAFYKKKLFIIADSYNFEFLKAYIPEVDNIIVLKAGHFDIVNGPHLSSLKGFFNKAIIPINAIAPRTAEILRILSPQKIVSMGNNLYLRNYSLSDYELLAHIEYSGLQPDFYCKMHRNFLLELTGLDLGIKIDEPIVPNRILNENYFVVNISASNKVHLPELSFFLDVAKSLSYRYHIKAVIIGDCSETEKNKIAEYGFDTSFLNLRDMQKTISLCYFNNFIITTDTGLFHLAMSFHKTFPVFVVTWGYNNVLFEPYPEELSKERLHFIQLFKDCSLCTLCKPKCWIDMKFKNTVQCVKKLNKETVIDYINNIYFK